MFQLIQLDNVCEDRDWRPGKEVDYYVWLPGFWDEETLKEEEDIPTGNEGPGSHHHDSEDSDTF